VLPFTETQFFDLFGRYNTDIWPAPLLAYCIGITALVASRRRSSHFSAVTFWSLGALWAWTGIVYHGVYFTQINPGAWLFAALFVAQSLIFVGLAFRSRPSFDASTNIERGAAWAMILYALAIYPLLNATLGHIYPRAPTFGVTPCPLVIFTFGVMGLMRERAPWSLIVAPLVWSLVGGSAAFLLGMPADWALPVAALVALAVNFKKQNSAADFRSATPP
jgi:hypothetical protein